MAARTKSKVTPKYKTKYRVKNWKEYEAALKKRGDITVWFDEAAIDAWSPSGARIGPTAQSIDQALGRPRLVRPGSAGQTGQMDKLPPPIRPLVFMLAGWVNARAAGRH